MSEEIEEFKTPDDFGYPTKASSYKIGTFVLCEFLDENNFLKRDFGFITNRDDKTDYYVVELLNKAGYVSCPIEKIQLASRA